MAKRLTDQMGGFLNDYGMLDFITITMYMGFFYFFLEYLTASRAMNMTEMEQKEKVAAVINNLVAALKDRKSKVGTGKNAMDMYDYIKKKVRKAPGYDDKIKARDSALATANEIIKKLTVKLPKVKP